MRNFRTPFMFKLNQSGTRLVQGDRRGVIGPFASRTRLVTDLDKNPYEYPDAFRLPRLPLPLLMQVGKFNRRMSLLKVKPQPAVKWEISGSTFDSVGSTLGNCVIDLFVTSTDVRMFTTQSSLAGLYSFSVGMSTAYYAVAYLAGTPDVAGTTVNTLTGIQV